MLFSVLINTADVNAENAAEEIILEELNRLRIEKDIPPLTILPLLSSCASSYAAALSERGYLSHTGGSGMRAVDRFRERGGTSLRVGEVLGSSPPAGEVPATAGRAARANRRPAAAGRPRHILR